MESENFSIKMIGQVRAVSRGETGVIFACKTLYVRPVSAHPLCCQNQPVRLLGELETEEVTHFLTPIKREIVNTCSPIECSDLMPVTFYSDENVAICQGAEGLTHCSGGMQTDPNTDMSLKFSPIKKSQSALGWTESMMSSHLQHIISEVISASSFQNR